MAVTPIQSAGRRFIQKFGVSFAWALLFSAVFGGGAFYRVPRHTPREGLPWHAELRLQLEKYELLTYDWRARALGDNGTRRDDVVLVAMDDETAANARESADFQLAARPWSRDLMGALMQRAVSEGAEQVVYDMPLNEISPRQCGGKQALISADDAAFGRRLSSDGRMLLTFNGVFENPRVAERELKATLLKAGDFSNETEARESVRRVLAARAPAYLIPEGKGVELWAAAVNEGKAKELAAALDLKQPSVFRAEGVDDSRHEVDAEWLWLNMAQVEVDGLSVSTLPEIKGIEGPVPAALSSSVHLGASNVVPDVDGKVRSIPLFFRMERAGTQRIVPSAVVRVAMTVTQATRLSVHERTLKIGKLSIPIDEGGYLTLRWDTSEVGRGTRGPLKRSIPMWRLALNSFDVSGFKRHDNELQGRIVVMADATGAPVGSPVGPVYPGAILGEGITNLLSGSAIERVPAVIDFYAVVAMAFAGAFLAVSFSSLFRRAGTLSMSIVLLLVLAAYALVARHLFLQQLRWVAMAAPAFAFSFTYLASLGYATTLETTVREFLGRALGRALPQEIAARLESNVSLMRPLRRSVAVYISDIEGFTSLAHRIEPETFVQVLQEHLGRMTRVVLETKGNVDKYLGDGVVAFWGAPVAVEDPAKSACEAAIKMREQFNKRRAALEKRCQAPLAYHCGIDFGEVLVGEMGTEHRAAYAVMGEPVATTARLQSVAQDWGVEMAVSQAVVEHVEESFVFRPLDMVRFPRHEAPVQVFELIAPKGEVEASVMERLQRFSMALGAFHSRRFSEASELFAKLEQDGDPIAARYRLRATQYANQPPAENWDGVYDRAERT